MPVQAWYIRFHPTDRHNWNCLRVEVYGTKCKLNLDQIYAKEKFSIDFVELNASLT